MQVEVGRVAVIPSGLLEINAIGSDVYFELFEQDRSTEVAPSFGALQFGQTGAEVVEAEGFTRQMGVGAGVCRQVFFDMAAVEVQGSFDVQQRQRLTILSRLGPAQSPRASLCIETRLRGC